MDNCEAATRPNARDSRFVQVCFLLIMRIQSGMSAWARRPGVAPHELGWARDDEFRGDDSRGLCHSLVCFQGLLVTVVGLDRFARHTRPLCQLYTIERRRWDAGRERQTTAPVIMARAAERA